MGRIGGGIVKLGRNSYSPYRPYLGRAADALGRTGYFRFALGKMGIVKLVKLIYSR